MVVVGENSHDNKVSAMRLLIVDANPKLRQLLAALFTDAHYVVDAVGSVNAARDENVQSPATMSC